MKLTPEQYEEWDRLCYVKERCRESSEFYDKLAKHSKERYEEAERALEDFRSLHRTPKREELK